MNKQAMHWGEQDKAQAAAQGWGVFEVWDQRVLYEILRDDNSNIFLTDAAARAYVAARAAARVPDPLARRALQLVFRPGG